MPILQPGRNVWRVARAHRAAVLIDAADFFFAVRKALMKAQHSVYIVGWDISSRTCLVGPSGAADDGWPEALLDFLVRLVKERPSLEVNILVWDYSLIYMPEREPLPSLSFGWTTPRQIRFRTDNHLPIGSSHHQKVIVIDDAVALAGGLDLTVRRWDTPEHKLDDPRRVDPSGVPYRPFHDVQMLVDGPAAAELATLAHTRWAEAWGKKAPAVELHGHPWPDDIVPDFREVDVGISRTVPAYDGQPEVREVETLFGDMIATAERMLYIENQFLSSVAMAELLVRRLIETPHLETLIVTPRAHDSWIEAHAMRPAIARFVQHLHDSGAGDRVRVVAPEVSDGQRTVTTTVHSKVMIVDDRLVRVGSANLTNRSMGTDTECDLSVETTNGADVRRVRDRLLADHCGVSAAEAARAVTELGSLVRAAESLSGRGHRLRRIDEAELAAEVPAITIEGIADPPKPLGAEEFMSALLGERLHRLRASKLTKLAIALAVFGLLWLAWLYTPMARFADPEMLQHGLRDIAQSRFAPVLVIGTFLLLELVAFPITLLIATTAAAFGPVLGFLYATAGVLASAVVTYGIGALLGKDLLREVLGRRMQHIHRALKGRGVLTIAAIRLVPIAPFAIVNAAAGALQVRLSDFFFGTIVGMAPGLLLMSALGHQITQLILHPTLPAIATFAAGVVAWIGLAFAAQAAVARFTRGAS